MLAEQGHLAGLVEQHTSIKRRASLSSIGHLHKMRKPDKKKRPKPKKKRWKQASTWENGIRNKGYNIVISEFDLYV